MRPSRRGRRGRSGSRRRSRRAAARGPCPARSPGSRARAEPAAAGQPLPGADDSTGDQPGRPGRRAGCRPGRRPDRRPRRRSGRPGTRPSTSSHDQPKLLPRRRVEAVIEVTVPAAAERTGSDASPPGTGVTQDEDREDHQPDAPQDVADEVGEVRPPAAAAGSARRRG